MGYGAVARDVRVWHIGKQIKIKPEAKRPLRVTPPYYEHQDR